MDPSYFIVITNRLSKAIILEAITVIEVEVYIKRFVNYY